MINKYSCNNYMYNIAYGTAIDLWIKQNNKIVIKCTSLLFFIAFYSTLLHKKETKKEQKKKRHEMFAAN